MNIMFKKKQKKTQTVSKQVSPMVRVDTEADVLPPKQNQTRVSFGERCEYTEVSSSRLKLKCKELQKIFLTIKNILEEQLDHLLIGEPIWQTYDGLLQSQLFRVRNITKQQLLDELGKVVQALQLLYSKLHNNEKIKDILYVQSQQDLLLFFKHLFGKPYTVCNLPNFRKVLNTIWQHQIFDTFDPEKMADHLRQWSAGIQFPLNPAAIPLHRLVFSGPSLIKKHALLLSNTVTYCNIDSGDCLGLNPLLVAAHSNKANAYEQIIKAGANLFKCPLVLIKNKKAVSSSKKSNKQMIQIVYPLKERRQFNTFQILLVHRQFQQIVNILSLNEVYKLKRMKKSNAQISNNLKQIPDCCFQIHWKTYKGFLSFKQLPKDVITVYKKGGSLRMDYHVDDLQQTHAQPGHFSILIRTGTEEGSSKLQYYFINHTQKKINNLMKQIHSEKLKMRYDQITQLGNIQQQYLSYIKSVAKIGEAPQCIDITAEFCYENISKAPIYEFKDSATYQRALFDSDVIDYSILEESETWCSLKQNVGVMPKVKSKTVKSSSNFKIQWVRQKITLKHITYILNLLNKQSPLFIKINKLFETLQNQPSYNGKYNNKLPFKMTIDLGSDFTLQAQIKNLTYMQLDDAVFGLEFRTKTMAYEEENVGLQSLQETMIMQENYSINMSRFLGKTEKLLDIQEQEANKKFEEMLSKQIAGNLSDEEDSSMNQKKKGNLTEFEKVLEDDINNS